MNFKILALSILVRSLFATTSDTAYTNKAILVKPTSSSSNTIQITKVYRLNHENDSDSSGNSAGIGDIIVIKVHGLKTLLHRSKGIDSDEKVIPGFQKKEIKLFIDGRMIDNILPESGAPQKDEGELQYHLQRSTNNDEAWADILGSPSFKGIFKRKAKISVGLDGGYAEDTIVDKFELIRIRRDWFYFSLLAIFVYFFLLIKYAKSSSLLKATGVDLSELNLGKSPTLPYSLGRVQMAFWFSLVLVALLFIWLVTGNYDVITTGILGLIGISAVTALSAVAIDANKGQDTIKQIISLQSQEATIINNIKSLQMELSQTPVPPSTTGSIQFNQAAQVQIQSQIKSLIDSLNMQTKGFINDLLNDVNGISFHRLQMMVWTIVLGIIFIYSVWSRLFMPDFSVTMLALQGITSGTYLGFKFPEKQS